MIRLNPSGINFKQDIDAQGRILWTFTEEMYEEDWELLRLSPSSDNFDFIVDNYYLLAIRFKPINVQNNKRGINVVISAKDGHLHYTAVPSTGIAVSDPRGLSKLKALPNGFFELSIFFKMTMDMFYEGYNNITISLVNNTGEVYYSGTTGAGVIFSKISLTEHPATSVIGPDGFPENMPTVGDANSTPPHNLLKGSTDYTQTSWGLNNTDFNYVLDTVYPGYGLRPFSVIVTSQKETTTGQSPFMFLGDKFDNNIASTDYISGSDYVFSVYVRPLQSHAGISTRVVVKGMWGEALVTATYDLEGEGRVVTAPTLPASAGITVIKPIANSMDHWCRLWLSMPSKLYEALTEIGTVYLDLPSTPPIGELAIYSQCKNGSSDWVGLLYDTIEKKFKLNIEESGVIRTVSSAVVAPIKGGENRVEHTYDGAKHRVFFRGSLVLEEASTQGWISSMEPFRLGSYYDGSSGSIGSYAIYDNTYLVKNIALHTTGFSNSLIYRSEEELETSLASYRIIDWDFENGTTDSEGKLWTLGTNATIESTDPIDGSYSLKIDGMGEGAYTLGFSSALGGPFTIEFKVRFDDIVGPMNSLGVEDIALYSQTKDASLGEYGLFYVVSSKKFKLLLRGIVTISALSPVIELEQDRVYHIEHSFTGGTHRVFLDGKRIISTNTIYGWEPRPTVEFRIGQSRTATYFDGEAVGAYITVDSFKAYTGSYKHASDFVLPSNVLSLFNYEESESLTGWTLGTGAQLNTEQVIRGNRNLRVDEGEGFYTETPLFDDTDTPFTISTYIQFTELGERSELQIYGPQFERGKYPGIYVPTGVENYLPDPRNKFTWDGQYWVPYALDPYKGGDGKNRIPSKLAGGWNNERSVSPFYLDPVNTTQASITSKDLYYDGPDAGVTGTMALRWSPLELTESFVIRDLSVISSTRLLLTVDNPSYILGLSSTVYLGVMFAKGSVDIQELVNGVSGKVISAPSSKLYLDTVKNYGLPNIPAADYIKSTGILTRYIYTEYPTLYLEERDEEYSIALEPFQVWIFSFYVYVPTGRTNDFPMYMKELVTIYMELEGGPVVETTGVLSNIYSDTDLKANNWVRVTATIDLSRESARRARIGINAASLLQRRLPYFALWFDGFMLEKKVGLKNEPSPWTSELGPEALEETEVGSDQIQKGDLPAGMTLGGGEILTVQEEGEAFDGESITYKYEYRVPPRVVYLLGGITYDPILSSSISYLVAEVDNNTPTGFTPVLKLSSKLIDSASKVELTTVTTDDSYQKYNTRPTHILTKAGSPEADSQTYLFKIQLNIQNLRGKYYVEGVSLPIAGSVLLEFFYDKGLGWASLGTRLYTGRSVVSELITSITGDVSFFIPGAGSGAKFGIAIQQDSGVGKTYKMPGSTIQGFAVEYYTASSGGSEVPATIAGGRGIPYFISGEKYVEGAYED